MIITQAEAGIVRCTLRTYHSWWVTYLGMLLVIKKALVTILSNMSSIRTWVGTS